MTTNRLTLALLAGCCFAMPAAAQDLVISNARILDGTGAVIERGTVVVRDGRIASRRRERLGRCGQRRAHRRRRAHRDAGIHRRAPPHHPGRPGALARRAVGRQHARVPRSRLHDGLFGHRSARPDPRAAPPHGKRRDRRTAHRLRGARAVVARSARRRRCRSRAHRPGARRESSRRDGARHSARGYAGRRARGRRTRRRRDQDADHRDARRP